jgi:hypothetical protein
LIFAIDRNAFNLGWANKQYKSCLLLTPTVLLPIERSVVLFFDCLLRGRSVEGAYIGY